MAEDVGLYYKGDDKDQHHVKLTTQTTESEVIVVAGVVVEGEQFDLVGLDRIVDHKTGAVSYNVGIWFDHVSDHEGLDRRCPTPTTTTRDRSNPQRS